MANNICERVIEHWTSNHRILPEIYQKTPGEIDEIIDGISDEYEELKVCLREAKDCISC